MPNIKHGRNEWTKKPDSVDFDVVEIILFCDPSIGFRKTLKHNPMPQATHQFTCESDVKY